MRMLRAHISTVPDWELEASVEHWERVIAEAKQHCPDDLAMLEDWRAEVTNEQERRARLAYRQARKPFDVKPVVEQIKRQGDILAVAGVRLQAAATYQSSWGIRARQKIVHFICPFHEEKSPSFAVYRDKNDWHCFGCQEHGDLISLVMKLDGLTFMQAVEQLAAEFGIEMPERKTTMLRGVAR